jgi:hypothetical protein
MNLEVDKCASGGIYKGQSLQPKGECMGVLTGLFGLALIVLVIVLSVMAVLTPFFVYRIRNEVIEINRKLSILADETRIIRPRQYGE